MALYRNAVSAMKLDSDCELYDNRLEYLLYNFCLFIYISTIRYLSFM